MEMDPLDELLQSYAGRPIEARYARDDSAVWREIERIKRQQSWYVRASETWRSVLLQPRLALGALAVALGVGALPALVAAREAPHVDLARQSLHLDVFSANSTTLRASFLRPRTGDHQ